MRVGCCQNGLGAIVKRGPEKTPRCVESPLGIISLSSYWLVEVVVDANWYRVIIRGGGGGGGDIMGNKAWVGRGRHSKLRQCVQVEKNIHLM